MDEIGEYHATWDKPISKNQRTNDLADKRMRTYNGGVGGVSVRARVRFRFRDKEGGKSGGRKDYRGKRGWEGWGEKGKNNNESNIITLYKCMITQMVCCYSMYKQKQHISHLFTIKNKFKKRISTGKHLISPNHFLTGRMSTVFVFFQEGLCWVMITFLSTHESLGSLSHSFQFSSFWQRLFWKEVYDPFMPNEMGGTFKVFDRKFSSVKRNM